MTWLLWECLEPEALGKLIMFQWEMYGTKLDLMTDPFKEVEDLDEIDHLMRQPTRGRKVLR